MPLTSAIRRTSAASVAGSDRPDEITPVGDGVLRDQVELEHTGRGKLLCFGDDVVRAARALFAAELRDHAERAAAVAAFGELDVGAGSARAQPAWIGGADHPVGGISDLHALGLAREHRRDREHVARAQEMIDLGQGFGELVGVALAQTAGDHELSATAGAFVLGQL